MRRLFHGRMITVDGHMRRMDENYNKFVIFNNNGVAYSLLQADLINVGAGNTCAIDSNAPSKDLRNVQIVSVKPGATYKFTLTKQGYDLFLVQLNANNLVLESGGWHSTGTRTLKPNTKKVGLGIGVGSAHTDPLTVGDVGIIITEE